MTSNVPSYERLVRITSFFANSVTKWIVGFDGWMVRMSGIWGVIEVDMNQHSVITGRVGRLIVSYIDR